MLYTQMIVISKSIYRGLTTRAGHQQTRPPGPTSSCGLDRAEETLSTNEFLGILSGHTGHDLADSLNHFVFDFRCPTNG